MTEPVLAVDDLGVELRTSLGWTPVVEHVTFDLRPGEVLGLVGESGSGKTVTSLAVMGLLPRRHGRLSSGTVRLGTTEMTTLSQRELSRVRGSEIAMVFQDPSTSLNPAFTVGEQIAETLRRHRGLSRRHAWVAAEGALARVHIPSAAQRAKAYPHEFSGGMRQRAALAVALACSPKVLIADEPTTALDVTIQAQVLELIHELRRELSMSIVFITHDLGIVADLADRVIVMYAGQIAEVAEVTELFARPRHPYAEGLLRSARIARRTDDLTIIPGQPPRVGGWPMGCRFHPRCAHAVAACAEAEVQLAEVSAGRLARCLRAGELDLTTPGMDVR